MTPGHPGDAHQSAHRTLAGYRASHVAVLDDPKVCPGQAAVSQITLAGHVDGFQPDVANNAGIGNTAEQPHAESLNPLTYRL